MQFTLSPMPNKKSARLESPTRPDFTCFDNFADYTSSDMSGRATRIAWGLIPKPLYKFS